MTKFLNKKDTKVVEIAVGVLRTGGILVIPTETAYGLAADAGNKKAIQKIYKIKGRTASKFLPLIVGRLEQMREFFELGEKELGLVRKYKGLTVVLNPLKHESIKTLKQRKLYLAPGQKTCAVRISKYKLVRDLALGLGRPITATSANVSGRENCYSVGEVMGQLELTNTRVQSTRLNQGKIDLIIDGGKLLKRKPSTIVRVEGGKVEVVRQGEIKIKMAKGKRQK
ncbi:MAG TPA: L-threonylcarbamoyladenylate synthase [Patescibacteria group bacterium]|nr:L-threonylcarbamoyladenylate synthase [Patescibacteria group bacterium]